MAQRNIDFGTFPDDPNADAIRTAFQKVQENFTELYSGLQEQAVLSVNKTQGAGITVNSPTGNVVITANIACVQVSTSTLSIGRGSNGSNATSITSSSQTLVIDLPYNIANIDNINISDTFTGVNANLSGNLTVLNANVTNFEASTANISNTLSVTGNANVGNIGATNGVFTNQLTVSNSIGAGNVYANSGIVGGLTGSFTGNITAANANLGNSVTANYFFGDGTGISNVVAVAGPEILNGNSNVFVSPNSNVTTTVSGNATQVITATGANINGYLNATGALTANTANLGNSVTANYFVGNLYGAANTASSATTAGTVTTASQPNITSVGTLTSLGVNGTVTAVAFTANTGVFTGNGSGLSAIAGANVTGVVANATYSVSAGSANSVAGANVTGTVANATYANTAGSATIADSANSVAGANVTGTVANATYAVTAGTANSVAGANVSGAVASANTAGTVTTNAQPNITSVGTLSALAVTGNLVSGNVFANSGVIKAQYLIGDGSNLTNISVGAGSFIENGNSEVRVDANSVVRVSVAGNANVVVVNGTGANINGYANVTGNITAGNVSATNVSGALLTGTLTTASQPNITSLGNLTSLKVNGISNLGPNSNVIITGGSNNQFLLSDGNGGVKWVTPANVTAAPGANTNIIFNDNGSINAVAGLSFNKTSNALTVSGNANVGNIGATTGVFTTIAGTLSTAAQPNITSVGTLTALIVSGNINSGNVTGNHFGNGSGLSAIVGANVTGTVANATYAVSAGSATTAGTVTTNAQPNITSVGDLTGLTMAANADITLSGTQSEVKGANLVSATFLTGTLTTAAQPNITSVGSLTSLIVSGNVNAGNITVGQGTITANIFSGNATSLSNIPGANVTGTVANATYATNAGTATNATTASTANSVAGANVTGTVANATFATSAGSATTAGTVTTAAQGNITSVGTLTGLNVNGTITGVNITANTGVFTGNGSALTSLNANNISTGTLAQARLANSSLTVNGTAISLGGSATITAVNPNALTIGTGLSGTSYNGSSNVTIAVNGNVVQTTGNYSISGVKTFTGTMIFDDYMTVAVSDETTAITTGTAKITFRAPYAMDLYAVPRASLSTASSSGNVVVDINVSGNSIFGAQKLYIPANVTTSVGAAGQATLTTTPIAVGDDAQITIDIDSAGTGAKGLKVNLYLRRANPAA